VPREKVAAALRRDFLVTEERADKLFWRMGSTSAIGQDVSSGLSGRTERVAQLRRSTRQIEFSGNLRLLRVSGYRDHRRDIESKTSQAKHAGTSPEPLPRARSRRLPPALSGIFMVRLCGRKTPGRRNENSFSR